MSALKFVAIYDRLRKGPLWKLLAADNAPIILALLQSNLMENEAVLPGSVLRDRLSKDIEDLRASGVDLRQTAQGYVSDWLANGWLTRRFPADASEEEYELSGDAARAIRMIGGLVEARTVATESRLSLVIQSLDGLARATDPDPESRLTSLEKERAEIERKIEAVREGRVDTLSEDRAIERVREIISLAGELASDFHQVREHFEGLNRELREQIMQDCDSRGRILESLFAGIDVIAGSDSGRTFYSFWRLLTDPEQNSHLEDSLGAVFGRDFARRLEGKERRFLKSLIRTLLSQGGMVHEVLQSFARSLKQFVQSREYQEQRLINQRIREAQQAALELKAAIRYAERIDFELILTSCRIRSVSQWTLFDPLHHTIERGMTAGEEAEVDLETIRSLLAHSEIDFRTLVYNIRTCLHETTQVSIAAVVQRFPIQQGLGSVVGYLALGSRSGIPVTEAPEVVGWTGDDGVERRARIPTIYFLRERLHELA